jgi:DNA polymerase elongation subunit (family B)
MSKFDKKEILGEIKGFLEGYNDNIKYLVNVETDPSKSYADCVIHEPGQKPKIVQIDYEPFMYMKDLGKLGHVLYNGNSPEFIHSMRIKYGIKIIPLKTGGQKRLVDGFCYKITSKYGYNSIINYLRDGGISPYEKLCDGDGNFLKDKKGDVMYKYRDLFYSPRTNEQFFISTRSRLFKGFEEYKDVHKLTFDCETTGLRYQIHRLFAIGVRDNRGFETILEVYKPDDNDSEIKLIQDFFNLINIIKPAVISGFNSENFDFDFILGRAKILKMDLSAIPTTLNQDIQLKRRGNSTFKHGSTAEKYTATEMWGYSIIDILHAAKKTAALNSDMKETKLKYLAKFEKVAKPNRTYISGEDNNIGRYYNENKIFVINENNEYLEILDEYQDTAKKLYTLQANKDRLSVEKYNSFRKEYLDSNPNFVDWLRKEAIPQKMTSFIGGKKLVKQYLLDDLWETEQIDELYNQSSFSLAKIIPTTYQRVCTMGTAAIWNLLLTAWSYENDIAIPFSEAKNGFSGGLARCYRIGYSKRIVKIDYASLYPMTQLTEDIFPMFDITGVIKKMLLYLTTTRNIYKRLASGDSLKEEEIQLLKEIDHETYLKLINNQITSEDKALFKIKQLPIKILNNSLFGALGSGISFNWSDNVCAARITCTGRIHLRHAVKWFSYYKLIPLLAVTDGINFSIPDYTNIRVTDEGVFVEEQEGLIEDMWKYHGLSGVPAIIEKYNVEEMKPPFMSVDNDGESLACLNLSRINYATLSLAKDKKTGNMKEKIKLTGNTIKSKTMPEYIEDFIDKGLDMILHGKGKEFVDYYYDYAENIRYMQIPLKKIASKSKVKISLSAYKKRGKDKNGRDKGMQAHMELLIKKRELIAEKLFQEHKHSLIYTKSEEKLSIDDKMKLVINHMPPEPELDSMVYYVNTGYLKSHGDSRIIKDKKTGEDRLCAKLISHEDLLNNPNMTDEYNYVKYLDAFNKRVETLLLGFEPEVRKNILVKLDKKTGNLKKEMFTSDQLELKSFELDTFDESMHMEKMEVIFWNKTGYDPRLIWDGFKLYDDYEHKIYYEIYDNALNYLNDLMKKSNKPLIKSINDKYEDGDFVLIKDGSSYNLGAYNGIYIEIIRTDIPIPKCEIELELDKIREEEEKRLQDLEIAQLNEKSDKELLEESEILFRGRVFSEFKLAYGLPKDSTMEQVFKQIDKSKEVFEELVSLRIDEVLNDNSEDDGLNDVGSIDNFNEES